MLNYTLFSILVITSVLGIIKLFKKRNEVTPDIPEPPQDHIGNYPD
jgi:hypothetical protein